MRRHPVVSVSLAALLAVTAVACGQAKAKPLETAAPSSSSTSKANPTTSAAPAAPIFPLTGMPLADPAAAAHPAVVVKMDNSPDARPQTGINQADIVYELLVEGITRYALVFHSEPSDPVGPVRSARSSDPGLLANLMRPIFVWSGGNPGVMHEISSSAAGGVLVDSGYDADPSDFYRDGTRKAPHNLYTNVSALLAHKTPADASTPLPLFTYLDEGATEPVTAADSAGVTIDFGQDVRADYVWDAERGGWDRFQVDQLHARPNSATLDSAGVQVAPANVVIMFMTYGQSPSDARSPMANSIGEGDAVVLSGGKAILGHWKRDNGYLGWSLTDTAGQPIDLTPGKTWVALPEVGSTVTPLDPTTAQSLLAVRK